MADPLHAPVRPWRPWLRLVVAAALIVVAHILPMVVPTGTWWWLYLLPSTILALATGLAFITAFCALCLGHEGYAGIEAALGVAFWIATAASVLALATGMPPDTPWRS